jgi:hypothetical protein
MQVDECAGDLPQRTSRHERAVDESTASPFCRHLAPDDEFAATGSIEDRFDRCRVLSSAHEIG